MKTSFAALFTPGEMRAIHPLHAIVLSFPLPMFLAALLSDIAYASSFHIQWINFASWLLVGGLIGGGLALVWVGVELVRHSALQTQRHIIHAAALGLMWVIGFIDSLVHGKDAGATMPESLWFSSVATLLALVASWVGFTGLRRRTME
jgi:uncharacterized membrane protein